jgi:hypothetical protein
VVHEGKITVESDWLPSAELARLLAAGGPETSGLTYDVVEGPEHRGLDPTITVAIVTGVFSLLVPFMTRLAERLFAAEPDASLTVDGGPAGDTIVVTAEVSAADAAELLAKAVEAGARNVRISISDKPA